MSPIATANNAYIGQPHQLHQRTFPISLNTTRNSENTKPKRK